MQRDYDIFEKFIDGSSVWRACVSGRFHAQRKIQEFAERSDNQFFAIDIQAGELLPFDLARSNKQTGDERRQEKRIA
jgi:hypothetical protein